MYCKENVVDTLFKTDETIRVFFNVCQPDGNFMSITYLPPPVSPDYQVNEKEAEP